MSRLRILTPAAFLLLALDAAAIKDEVDAFLQQAGDTLYAHEARELLKGLSK